MSLNTKTRLRSAMLEVAKHKNPKWILCAAVIPKSDAMIPVHVAVVKNTKDVVVRENSLCSLLILPWTKNLHV